MKEYLKMSDVFDLPVKPSHVHDEIGYGFKLLLLHSIQSECAAHAISHHDELVEMNKELLKALEAVIKWYDMEADHSIEPDFYKRMDACQVSEDMAREAITKAKGIAV